MTKSGTGILLLMLLILQYLLYCSQEELTTLRSTFKSTSEKISVLGMDSIKVVTLQQEILILKRDQVCLKAQLVCDAREDQTFPCISPFGDTLRGNLLIKGYRCPVF